LRRQAAESRAAAIKTADDVCGSAVRVLSPKVWISRHPLATVGFVTIGGMLAARFLLPPARRAATESTSASEPVQKPDRASDGPTIEGRRWTRRLLGMLADSLVGAGIGAVTQGVMAVITHSLMAAAKGEANGDDAPVNVSAIHLAD